MECCSNDNLLFLKSIEERFENSSKPVWLSEVLDPLGFDTSCLDTDICLIDECIDSQDMPKPQSKSSTYQSDVYTSLAVNTSYEISRLQIMAEIINARINLLNAQYEYFDKMREIYSNNEHQNGFTDLNSIA